MKRFCTLLFRIFASPRLTPLVIAVFSAIYVGIAFFSDEALITLIFMVKTSWALLGMLLIIPLNVLFRLVQETKLTIARRQALQGAVDIPQGGLFDETVTLPAVMEPVKAQAWLTSAGYRVLQGNGVLVAVRGVSLFPARLLYLLGVFSLFLGIVLSVGWRDGRREAVIEGEPLPGNYGMTPRVERIELRAPSHALLLARDLAITVRYPEGEVKTFGLYPPGLINGRFLYPRYLGVAPLVEFSAPDLQPGIADYYLLMLYPPGREDSITIPNSPYKISVRLVSPSSGDDPFVTGNLVFHCRAVSGEKLLFEGEVPLGGAFAGNGYRLAFPEARKMVAADFIQDYGVPLIWLATLLFVAALLFYLPVRFGNPRREILLLQVAADIHAFSHAEGCSRQHAGVFHETLDQLAGDRAE